MNWEVVIGLEVHTELSTETKIFCGCTTAFGGEPNTHVCPVCAGMPGSLPVLNRAVPEYAIRLGLALGCEITRQCTFDRKNYFYPDLPKAYQISQLYAPICRGGKLAFEVGAADTAAGASGTVSTSGTARTADTTGASGTAEVRIREIHMEEDAGKLFHTDDSSVFFPDYTKQPLNVSALTDAVTASGTRTPAGARVPAGGVTLVDFNRCGVPLLEIVTEPDFRSAAQVLAFLVKLREILLFLGISDCKMQEGSLRADVNISVRPVQSESAPFGVRTEMKNLGSFKAIGRAIAHESARQIRILEEGGKIIQETRRWDDDNGASHSMRTKENAQDYRYFPEPDLPPFEISDEWIGQIRRSLPELAHEKRERYISAFGLSAFEASVITSHKKISGLFEDISAHSGQPLESARLVTGEIMRLMNQSDILPENLSADAKKLAVLVTLVCAGKINRNAYKEAVGAVFTDNADPEEYIAAHGLLIQSDSGVISEAIAAVLRENEKVVAQYRDGKDKALGFLMGQAMRKLGGSADPAIVRDTLLEALEL